MVLRMRCLAEKGERLMKYLAVMENEDAKDGSTVIVRGSYYPSMCSWVMVTWFIGLLFSQVTIHYVHMLC